MSEILNKYNITFNINNGITTVSSVSPLLSYYLNHSAITQATELYNGLKHTIRYKRSKEQNVIQMRTFTIKMIEDDVQIIYKDPENLQNFPENTFTIPVDDLLAILLSWREFLISYKVREIEVKDGQGIIDIISDGFATALVIEKTVAVNWPDCAGSIGEYYAVSRENYDRQKALTADLIQSLTDGSDKDVFAAITIFLDLFANGKYKVVIGAVDVSSAEIAYDIKMTYADEVDENKTFTYGFYPYGYGEVLLFSRSINTIDENRVKEYVETIKNGNRPKIVLFAGSSEDHSYVIDGHHKLLAYQKLGITAPAVIISKGVSLEKSHENITPQLLDILKPVEAMHILKENDNITALEVYISPRITSYLDDILIGQKSIGITIPQLLYNTYNSTEKDIKGWANERLSVLSKNKNQGNGQFLYYKQSQNSWTSMYIEDHSDFELWEKILLKGGEIPADLSERQKIISERYHKPYRPVQNNNTIPSYLEQPRTYPVTPTSRIIVKILGFSLIFLTLLKACR